MSLFDSTMSPSHFFEKLIPEMAATKSGELSAEQKAVKHSLAIVLTGSGGGEWSIHTEGGNVTVTNGVHPEANPVIALEVDTWRDVLSGEKAAIGVGGDISQLDVSRLKPELQTRLAPIKGTLKLVVEDDDGDVEVLVKFGQGAPETPTATITTNAETAQNLQSGKMNPQMAFMQGTIKIAGDMNLAMQVATLQM